MFFFSSRRRHTRCLSDWSSDVCSSDLPAPSTAAGSTRRSRRKATRSSDGTSGQHVQARPQGEQGPDRAVVQRSEERRVGKECRTGTIAEDKQQEQTRADETNGSRV